MSTTTTKTNGGTPNPAGVLFSFSNLKITKIFKAMSTVGIKNTFKSFYLNLRVMYAMYPMITSFRALGERKKIYDEELGRYKPLKSDVICSIPAKSGTTFVMHICHCLRVLENPNASLANLDFEDQMDVMPWLEGTPG